MLFGAICYSVDMEIVLLVITLLLTSLLAGVFFAFSVAVNGGLARLEDRQYLLAMKHINKVILNPLFMVTFMGPVVLLPLVMFLYGGIGTLSFWLYGIATVAYIGTFLITAAGNVPLNDRLEKFSVDDADRTQIASMRATYEGPWNRLHTVRTVLAIMSVTVFAFAMLL